VVAVEAPTTAASRNGVRVFGDQDPIRHDRDVAALPFRDRLGRDPAAVQELDLLGADAHVIAKVNAATGEITRIYEGSVPGNGATLVTAGDLVFWGDLNQKFRAFDADTGKTLWEITLGGPIQTSTITYRVNGKQYVAVMTALGAVTTSLFPRSGVTGINPQRNNAIHVFALPN